MREVARGGGGRKKLPETALDGKGKEVRGDEAREVWRRAFEALGKKKSLEERFDKEFAGRVESEVMKLGRGSRYGGEGRCATQSGMRKSKE